MRRKTTNSTFLIHQREYGVPSNFRHCRKIIRHLICKKNRKFMKVWERTSNYNIAYESGKLFFDNFRTCFTVHGKTNLPTRLYGLTSCPTTEKIEDALIYEYPLCDIPLQHRGYRPSLLALQTNGWLCRYDVDTGQLLQKVYLSTRFKFRHISWDVEGESVTLKSTHVKMLTLNRQAGINPNYLLAVVTFSIYPLQFKYLLVIDKDIFGKDVSDAQVTMGSLVITHRDGTVRIYSMHHILQQGRKFEASLGETCPNSGSIVGSPPSGLPTNITLTERPPILFEVRKSDYLCIGGIPWHYISSKTHNTFYVKSLDNHLMAEDGELCSDEMSLTPDKCYFHSDDSGRVIYTNGKCVQVLRFDKCANIPHSSEKATNIIIKTRLKEEFTITPEQKSQVESWSVSSSGRVVKKRQSYNELLDYDYETIQTVDYEDELDVMVIGSAVQAEEGYTGHVCFHDNDTGELLLKVTLEEPWKELCDHTICVDLDTIIHITKGPMRQHTVCVYVLDRRLPDDCTDTDSRRTSSRAKRALDTDGTGYTGLRTRRR